jgi:aminoglycoside phosphotransferase (APT) family kinase protein
VSDPTALLQEALGPSVSLSGLRRLSGGASRETWSFDADGRPLILRRDPPGAPKAGMDVEARLLRAAAAVGVPVPEVVVAEPSFIVMQRLEGETIPRKILRDEEYASARPMLAAQCGSVLASLHRIPVEDFADLPDADQLEEFRVILDSMGQPHPAFELGFKWLSANRPSRRGTVVVHGDFRNGNLIVGPEGVRAVLDWELAHRGDPLEDLAWLCVKAWRFGVVDKAAGGFGSYDELVGAYEAAGGAGAPVDRDALRWWEALGTLKWGIMCIAQAMMHVSGVIPSVELAAIGRRVCENEWDLLDLLPYGAR